MHADDAWIFKDLPITLRRDPMKDDTDTIRVDLIPHSEDDEEEEMVELPEGYMSKRCTVLNVLFADEDDWATDYESDGDVPMKLAVSPPKPKLNPQVQHHQWQEEFRDDAPMMSDTESIHSDPDYLTMREDREKIELRVALDFEIEGLHEEAKEVECALHLGLYDTYSVAYDSDVPYDYDEDETIEAKRLLDPAQEYDTWPVAADSDTPFDSEDDDLSGEWSSKKKRKVMDTIEELDMESLYISQEEESEYDSDAENEGKPAPPRLIHSSEPSEWRFGFTELQTPYTIETVQPSRSFGDNLPLSLGLISFGTPTTASRRRTAQLATPPDSNRGSASPMRGMRMDLDGSTSPSPSTTGSLFDDYSPPEPSTPIHPIPNWGRIMSQHFPDHAKHLCKSGRTPQAELEYIRKNSGFNTTFIDELDRMYPRKNKPMMQDAVMPRTGRRAPVTEKRGDFVLAEDYTATEGRSRAQLQYWSSA